MQTMTWIVLADGARGRILVQERIGSPLRRAFDEEDLAGERRREPASERPGRSIYDPRSDPQDKAERAFCLFVAGLVSRAALERRFERLILVAPPQMLGDLRKALSPHARNLVTSELAKNWLRLPDVEVAAHLRDALRSPMASHFVPSGL